MKAVLSLIAAAIFLTIPALLSGHVPQLVTTAGGPATIKWPAASTITYRYNTGVPTALNVEVGSTTTTAINSAFSTIGGSSGLTFVNGATSANTSAGADAVNLITFASTPTNLSLVGGALAVCLVNFNGSQTITEADIVFNPAMNFSTLGTAGFNDIQSVATHEIGHFVGLDHTPMLDATMNPAIAAGSTYFRTIDADDKAGFRSLYPGSTSFLYGTVSGTIQRAGAVAVAGAHLILRDSITGRVVTGAVSRANGTFSITGAPAGLYELYAEPLDGPFSSANLMGSGWTGVTFDTTFRPAVLGGTGAPTPVVVHGGGTTNVGTFVVAGPASTIGIVAAALIPTAFSGFSFSNGQPVSLTPPYTQFLVVIGPSVNAQADSAFSFQSPFVTFTGGSQSSGTVGANSFKVFPISVAAAAPPGGYMLRILNAGGEMTISPGLLDVKVPATPLPYSVAYGTGCTGPAGPTVLFAPVVPALGSAQFRLSVTNTATTETVFYLFSATSDSALTLPGCTVNIDLNNLIIPFPGIPVPAANGTTLYFIPLPSNPAIDNLDIYTQAAVVVNATSAVRVTNALMLHID